jgi:hypothetical protein
MPAEIARDHAGREIDPAADAGPDLDADGLATIEIGDGIGLDLLDAMRWS